MLYYPNDYQNPLTSHTVAAVLMMMLLPSIEDEVTNCTNQQKKTVLPIRLSWIIKVKNLGKVVCLKYKEYKFVLYYDKNCFN